MGFSFGSKFTTYASNGNLVLSKYIIKVTQRYHVVVILHRYVVSCSRAQQQKSNMNLSLDSGIF